MSDLSTSIPELVLTNPLPERDAAFALSWFDSEFGRDTLLKMGNAPDEIHEPTLEGELATIKEFLTLESDGKQKTWMMRYGEATIGAAWIDLVESHGVKAPSIHLMIGDPSFRGKGLGRATMSAMINYLKENGNEFIYSRHLVSNEVVTGLNHSLGFSKDGQPYIDNNGLEWQNIKLSLKSYPS
jgi:GNAT superfamily N-acetyltransferase